MIPTRHHRIRVLCIAFLILAGMMGLGYRLYTLQVVRHDEFRQAVSRQHDRRLTLPALRGSILDRNENILAHSISVRTVVLDPQCARDEDARRAKDQRPSQRSELVQLLSEQLLLPKSVVQQKLDETGRYVVLKRKVPEETARQLRERLKQLQIRSVIFEEEQMRVYPNGPLMSHVLGFVNSEQHGMDGVEVFMQSDLQGQDGWRRIECDRRGNEIVVYRNEDFAPRDGYNVVLTLDQVIQNITEQELDRAVQKYRPESAVVIVMRPSTGEVLAMASRPGFDPNAIGDRVGALKNRAVADLIEPGSTFKIVAVATALDYRLISLNDTIWCENGRFLYGGRYLNDHTPHGNLTVAGILVHSSSIGSAKIALMLGNERMYQAMRNFGFGDRTFGDQPNERWPGEVRGIVHPLSNWSKVSITRVAMGHEVAVTPLQMIAAMSALANGGNLMRPQIVKKVMDSEGRVVREFFPQVRRRVVDQKTAHEITTALEQVVSKEGTAAKASIPGFAVAGKTGTAQKLVNGQYVHDQYISSFSGYFPADDPEVCIYVMLDNPKGKDKFGGAVAAPLFHDIGIRVASYLNLKPSSNPGSPVEPSVSILSASNGGTLR